MNAIAPKWVHDVKRSKARGKPTPSDEIDWHARFLELRERYVKLVQDNLSLRNQLKNGIHVKRRHAHLRGHERYELDGCNHGDEENIEEQIDGLSHVIANTEW